MNTDQNHTKAFYKSRNSDFHVQEVISVPPCASIPDEQSRFTILEVTKSGFTTFEVLDHLARILSLDKKAIRFGGLKDEDGITTQYFSIQQILDEAALGLLQLKLPDVGQFIRIRRVGYAASGLQEKRLHGNVFRVVVRNLSGEHADKLRSYCDKGADFSFVNYYDQQRFGLPGGPYVAHQIGRAIAQDDWQDALRWYEISGNAKLDFPEASSLSISDLKLLNTRKLDFFVSAYTSKLWNDTISAQLTSNLPEITIFDDWRVKSAVKVMQVNSEVAGFEYGASGVVGVAKSRPAFVTTFAYCGPVNEDELNPGKSFIQLEFFLPKGSYATMLLKQLLSSVCGLELEIPGI